MNVNIDRLVSKEDEGEEDLQLVDSMTSSTSQESQFEATRAVLYRIRGRFIIRATLAIIYAM